MAATKPHAAITRWVLETTRVRSIQAHADGIVTPPDYNVRSRIVDGAVHFSTHCAVCHGAPGGPPGDIAHGLYPKPPDLRDAARNYKPAELFWIVKHGFKFTGMPAWSDHSDDELWATVAFIKALPEMSEADYAELVKDAAGHGDHHHHHDEDES